MSLKGKNILITGGSGSFGKKFAEIVLRDHAPERLVIYSRDEFKQFQMQSNPVFQDPRIRFFLGDVRDRERLARAFAGIDVVVHAAAIKQVPAAEYNPFEAVKTNILGAENIINCAIDAGVERVIALSTDKAANPVNLYGATKLCSDKLFIAGNAYVGSRATKFFVVRYGNVVGSRGSVVPFFLRKRREGTLPITDDRMTRFWITLEQGVNFVIDCLGRARGGELFVPKIPSMRITDLARVIAPEAKQEIIGIRPGEKLHEVMVTEDDARNTVQLEDRFVCLPPFSSHSQLRDTDAWLKEGTPCDPGFRYGSDNNTVWLSEQELVEMIGHLDLPEAQEWVAERRDT